MSARTCPGHGCGAVLRDGFTCRSCQRKAEIALGDLLALTRELEVTVCRQDRITTPGHRPKGSEQPLAVNLTAESRGRVILELLFEWADYVAQWQRVKGLPLFARDVPLTTMVPHAVGVLLQHSEWMRSNEQGPVLVDAVHQIRRDLRRLIDQPPERLYAGPCHADLGYDPELNYRCQAGLYRKWGSEEIVCDGHQPMHRPNRWAMAGCGHTHLPADRKEFLVASVSEHLLPLRLVWAALYELVPGCDVSWDTAQRWTRARKERVTDTGRRVRVVVVPPRLEAATVDWRGQPLYRGSDVLRLARDDQPRRGRRRVRRGDVA